MVRLIEYKRTNIEEVKAMITETRTMSRSVLGSTATQICAATAGFAVGYLGFTVLVGDEMTLHRVAAGVIIGLVGALAATSLANLLRERHGPRSF